MQYVVCYDIVSDTAGDQRRSRVSHALLDFGKRVQDSVFLADLDEDLASRMHQRLTALIDHRLDRLHVFALCAACEKRTWTAGVAELPEDREFYVI